MPALPTGTVAAERDLNYGPSDSWFLDPRLDATEKSACRSAVGRSLLSLSTLMPHEGVWRGALTMAWIRSPRAATMHSKAGTRNTPGTPNQPTPRPPAMPPMAAENRIAEK